MYVATFCIDPFGVEVGKGGLVGDLFESLGRLLVDDAARSPPSAGLGGAHPVVDLIGRDQR